MFKHTTEVFDIPEPDKSKIHLEGQGRQKLLCISDADSFGDQEKSTLEKMITAIKYDSEKDIFILTVPQDCHLSLSNLGLEYKDILLFGIRPDQIGLQVEYSQYTILHFDQRNVLVCDSIRQINAVPQKKQVLWGKLQEMFLK